MSAEEAALEGSKPAPRNPKWKRRTRVLVLCSRQVDYRSRHLLNDFKRIMPHSKAENKFARKKGLGDLVEIAEMKNCSKIMYMEVHKKKDCYLYLADAKLGVSAVFLLHNICTMEELKLTGNCLKGSRPILSFDSNFDEEPHLKLFKELFISVFSVPHFHPKSQPFIDHVFNFSIMDNKIWFRNYQILQKNSGAAEIGPRMVMEPVKILDGCFSGNVIYKNPLYTTPNSQRSFAKLQKQNKSHNRLLDRIATKTKKSKKGKLLAYDDEVDAIFENE